MLGGWPTPPRPRRRPIDRSPPRCGPPASSGRPPASSSPLPWTAPREWRRVVRSWRRGGRWWPACWSRSWCRVASASHWCGSPCPARCRPLCSSWRRPHLTMPCRLRSAPAARCSSLPCPPSCCGRASGRQWCRVRPTAMSDACRCVPQSPTQRQSWSRGASGRRLPRSLSQQQPTIGLQGRRDSPLLASAVAPCWCAASTGSRVDGSSWCRRVSSSTTTSCSARR